MPSGHYKNSTVTMESSDGGDSMENYNGDHHMMDTKNGNNDHSHHNQNNTKPMTSFDPIEYVQRTRTTKPVFAKPAADPLQFIKVKPCNLYQTAQEQLKKAEEVKKVKEIKKEEPEDWQSNLDNWKSSRRKRVEHIIDRVVEVKKFEMDEFDRTRRKSKTFSEMLEERGSRGTKVTLPVYAEDDANDLTDLGIGTSSTSCKSSVSEDFDNHSVVSDSQESTNNSSTNNDHPHSNGNNSDYDNPSSPINTSEYTYEGAIQGYKTRISNKFQTTNFSSNKFQTVPDTTNLNTEKFYNFNNRFSSSGDKFIKTQERFFNNNNNHNNNNNTFELENNNNNNNNNSNDINVNLPKIDISKKKELFENRTNSTFVSTDRGVIETVTKISPKVSEEFSNAKSIKERLSTFGRKDTPEVAQTKEINVKVDVEQKVSLKDRLSNFEKQIVTEKSTSAAVPSKIDVPIVSLKDRLSSLQSNISQDGKANHNKELDDGTNNINSNRCVVFEMNNSATINHVVEPVRKMPKEIEPKIEPEHKKVEYFHERNEVKLVINEEPIEPVATIAQEVEEEVASNQAVDEHEISVLGSGVKELVADCNVKNNSSSTVTILTSNTSHNHSLIDNIAELCEKVEHCETHRKPILSHCSGLPVILDMEHKIPSLPTSSPIKNIELNTSKNFNSMLTFMRNNISSTQQQQQMEPPTSPPPAAPSSGTNTRCMAADDDEFILNENLRKLDDVLNSIEHLHISGVDEILDEELNKLDLEID